MSLRAFHILFIIVSILLSLGTGIWGLRSYFSYGEANFLLIGSFSILVMGGLVSYGIWFLKKLKRG